MAIACYGTECEACGVETEVDVFDESEAPQFCPMCGFAAEWYQLEEDED